MKMLYRIKEYCKSKRFCFSVDSNTRILVISPHPDDESIGMGGFLSKYHKNCTVLLATNGCCGNPEWDRKKTIEIRRNEFIMATERLGVSNFLILDINDRELYKNLQSLKQDLSENYDYIFVPNRNDNHKDHRCIYRYVVKMKRIMCLKARIVEYEVWTPLSAPNLYVDISDVRDNKERAIKLYKSQLMHCKYDSGSMGLSQYRGMLSGYNYAEAFLVRKNVFEKLLDKAKIVKDTLGK